MARSRLYRSRFLQVNIRWKALAEIYKIYMLLHRSDLNISGKFLHEFWHFFTKFQIASSKSCNFRDDLRCNFIDNRSPRKCGEEKRKKKIWNGARKSSRVTSPNFVGISQNVQKILPHTENVKKILGFFNFAC